MNIVVALKPLKGSSKRNGRFSYKIALHLKKACYKVSLSEYSHDRVVRHSLVYLSVQKWFSLVILYGRN